MWLDDYTHIYRIFEFLEQQDEMAKQQNFDVFGQLLSSPPHVELLNIKLVFYPKNTTSRLQAMHQGVIANLKKNYAKHVECCQH